MKTTKWVRMLRFPTFTQCRHPVSRSMGRSMTMFLNGRHSVIAARPVFGSASRAIDLVPRLGPDRVGAVDAAAHEEDAEHRRRRVLAAVAKGVPKLVEAVDHHDDEHDHRDVVAPGETGILIVRVIGGTYPMTRSSQSMPVDFASSGRRRLPVATPMGRGAALFRVRSAYAAAGPSRRGSRAHLGRADLVVPSLQMSAVRSPRRARRRSPARAGRPRPSMSKE